MIEVIEIRVQELIKNGESETVEFKESFNDDALETIGAFANSKGGVVLVGMQDSGKISGLQIGRKTLEDIANRVQEVTDPRIQPSISTLAIEEKTIIIIQVASATGAPVSIKGRYFRRVGKTNQRMSHEEIMQRLIARAGLSWDAYIEDDKKLSDLNEEQIEHFILDVKEKGRLSIPAKAKNEDVLRKLELIQDGSPTRAALLLFGNNPNSYFSSAFLKMGTFSITDTHSR